MRKSKLAETKGRDLKLKNREKSEKVRSEIRIDENLSIFEERKGGDKIVLMYSSVNPIGNQIINTEERRRVRPGGTNET